MNRAVALCSAVLLAAAALAGCSSEESPRPAASASPGGSGSAPAPSPSADVLARVQRSSALVADARTGRYEVVQRTPTTTGTGDLRRFGAFDDGAQLHELRVLVPPSGADRGGQLLFLITGAGDVFVSSPAVTQRTKKRWGKSEAARVSATSDVDVPTAATVQVPGTTVVAGARGPAVELPPAPDGGSRYAVQVSERDTLSLLSSRAVTALARQRGLDAAGLEREFGGVLKAEVELDPQGRLRALQLDLGPVVNHLTRLRTGRPSAVQPLPYRMRVVELDGPVTLSVPPPADVAPLT